MVEYSVRIWAHGLQVLRTYVDMKLADPRRDVEL